MRKIRLHVEASREALEAAAWYERHRPGPGADFQLAVDAALDLIEEGIVPLQPVQLSARIRSVRRLGLKRFPFDVVVVERDEEALIVAFAHHARRPGYWRQRRG